MRKLPHIFVAALAVGLAACAGLTPPGNASAKTDLFEAEATYTGALSGAGAYLQLPACDASPASKVCKDQDVASKIGVAVDAAQTSLANAETVVLGCPKADYVASTATPPTGTCGTPIADQAAAQQALTAAMAAVNELKAAIPLINGGN